jgi:hypothetical protein
MKKLNLVLISVLCLSHFSTYANNCCAITITRSAQLQEEKATGSFKGVATGGPINVVLTMGMKESVRLEGDADAVAALTTEIINGVLIIKPVTKWNDWSRKYRNARITAYIKAKRITSLTKNGSGDIEIHNTLSGTDLTATLSGSGSIRGEVNLKSFTGVISGSGSMDIGGKAENSNVTLSGSGQFNGKDLAVNDLSVQVSGSANVYINAIKSIEAVISGSGNVFYSGSPTIEKTIIGSGRIRKL